MGRVDEHTGMITLFDVDMEGMGKMMNNPEFQALVEPYVDHNDIFTFEPLAPPA